MQHSVDTAKTQLSTLIEVALAGEEVVIAKGSRPVARLVAIPQGQFRLGALRPAGSDPRFPGADARGRA